MNRSRFAATVVAVSFWFGLYGVSIQAQPVLMAQSRSPVKVSGQPIDADSWSLRTSPGGNLAQWVSVGTTVYTTGITQNGWTKVYLSASGGQAFWIMNAALGR